MEDHLVLSFSAERPSFRWDVRRVLLKVLHMLKCFFLFRELLGLSTIEEAERQGMSG